tara:strand:+ start:1633 stop:1803 length:171 start_codon:yes stop_codon:yes gene_type:complete
MTANKITTFRDKGWRTNYTGSFRVEDDGKLKPQLYLHKIKAKKNKPKPHNQDVNMA